MFQALNAHHQEANRIGAASGIVTRSKWPFSAQVETERSSLSTCAPDGH